MPRRDDGLRSLQLQEFLDDEGSWLRRVAFLLTDSWTEADEALAHTTTQLVRQRTDLSDGPSAMRSAWPLLIAFLHGRDVVPPPPPATEGNDPTPYLLAALPRLDFDERAALVLTHLARLDDAMTSRCLDVAPQDIAPLVARAVEHLQQTLAAQGDHLRLSAPANPPSRQWRPAATTVEEAQL